MRRPPPANFNPSGPGDSAGDGAVTTPVTTLRIVDDMGDRSRRDWSHILSTDDVPTRMRIYGHGDITRAGRPVSAW